MTSGRERKGDNKGKGEERTRMEIYVPDPAGIGMLDGRSADWEVGGINPRKKGMNGEEEVKIAPTGDLSSGPQRDTAILVGEIQLLEVTTNRNDDREQNVVQDPSDPASKTGKRKLTSAAWDADRSSRPPASHDDIRTRDDDLTPTVYSNSGSPILAGPPAWKRLASRAFLPHEVISLIEATLMTQDEVKTIGNLCGDDAQDFVDVVHEVPSPLLCF